MTKKMTALVMAVFLVFVFCITGAETGECNIICQESVNERRVQINGKIENVTGIAYVSILVGEPENILYMGQVESNPDGTFAFNFSMPKGLATGTYSYRVGSNTDAPMYYGTITYVNTAKPTIVCQESVNERRVQINGKIENVTGIAYVSILVGEPENILYMGQVESNPDGTFAFNFSMPKGLATGTYSYRVGSNVGEHIFSGTLDYIAEAVEPDEPPYANITANVAINQKTLLLSGQITSGANQSIKVTIITSQETILNEALCKSDEDGNFSMQVQLTNSAVSGVYAVKLENQTVAEPVTIPFLLISEKLPQDIVKSQNLNLYNAMRKARPYLDLDSDGIITIQELSEITGALDISSSNIESLEGIQSCTAIAELYINNNRISDLSPIEGMTNLKTLIADNNRISVIAALPINLELINIEKNQITNFECVAFVNDLKIFFASDNNISSIDFLMGKTKLTHLSLADNAISSISPLCDSSLLTYVDLSNNSVTDISVLSDKTNLTDVRLSYNGIVDASSLPDAFYRNLYIDNNFINPNEVLGYKAINKVYLPQK